MVWSDKLAQFVDHFLMISLGMLIKDDLTSRGRLNQISGQLGALFRLDTQALKLVLELVDAHLPVFFEITGFEDKWRHLVGM